MPAYSISRTRRTNRVLSVVACLSAFLIPVRSAQGQSQDQPGSATLYGSVLDSHGHAVGAAAVYLRTEDGTQTLTTSTDLKGSYRFSALNDGVYNLRAEMSGYASASFGPCVLGPRETKKVDLTLESAISAPNNSPGKSSGTAGSEKPQYFDEPQFTVAGVTDAANPGGHGSEAILRTTESLAMETAALGAPAKTESSSAIASPSSSAVAEQSLRTQVERESDNFELNYRLGKVLVDDGKAGEAIAYLERASQVNPTDYENAYELALARVDTGQYERARTDAQALLVTPNRTALEQAELHHLLGNVEEKLGNPLDAVHEYQRAAEFNPSEPNLFDWGTDLLLHRAFEPAIEVFAQGNRLFPRSARMLTGTGVAWYARGAYEQAAHRLCEASDINPADPSPYLFLGKVQSVEAMLSDCVLVRLKRFVRLQPDNALANYYYALVLSKQDGSQDANNLVQAELLLEKAVRLDPKLAPAYLQLGILYSQRGESTKAISAYKEAIKANPQSEEAHYRLAQAYSRAGDKLEAQAELQIYREQAKKTAEQADHDRREVQQFVYTLREQTPGTEPRLKCY